MSPDAAPPSPARTAALRSLAGDVLLVALAAALVLVELRPVFVEGRAAAGPYRLPDAAGVLLLAATLGPVLARRRWPLAAAVTGLGASLVYLVRDYVPFGAVELVTLLLVYSGANHGRPIPRAAALGALAAWLLMRELGRPFGFHLPGYAIECVVYGGAWVLGASVRARRAVAGQLAERAALLERDRAMREREAAQRERLRIARELHDVIAHHLSVIVIQAQAAAALLGGNGGAARDALDAVETSGRQALTEMRRTLGLLRRDDADAAAMAPDAAADAPLADLDGDKRTPQPGLDAVAALAAQFERAGLAVDLDVRGEPRALPRAVDLSAYRIVEEALTNSLRHGTGSGGGVRGRAVVRLCYAPDRLEFEITDDGPVDGDAAARRADQPGGSGEPGGSGHIGMRERVALLGGELVLGPRAEGGYRVRVSLPLDGSAP